MGLHPIRLVLIDEQTIPRAGLRLLLESRPEFRVLAEAADARTALTIATPARPDVIVLTLPLGEQDGTELLPDLRATAPHSQILVLTSLPSPQFYQQAIRLGARGVVYTEQSTDILFEAITKVHAGEVWLDPAQLSTLLDELAPHRRNALRDPEEAKIATLSAREREVIALVGEGLRNKAIAKRLFISDTTVRHHLTSIFHKLDVTDRLDLVLYAFRHQAVPFTNKPRLTFKSVLPLWVSKGPRGQRPSFPIPTLSPLSASHRSPLTTQKKQVERGHDVCEQPPSSTEPSRKAQQKRKSPSHAERSEYHVGTPNNAYGKPSTSSGNTLPNLSSFGLRCNKRASRQ